MQSVLPLLKNNFIQSKKVRLVFITIFLLSACIQNIVLFEIGASFKLVHLVGILLFPVTLLLKPARSIGKCWWLAVGTFTVYTVLAYLRFGFNSWLLNGTFCVYTVWCVWKLSEDFGKQDWLTIFRITAVVMILLVFANMCLQFEAIWRFMQDPGSYHPVYETVFGGGPNLDASWIGLFCFAMVGTVWWRPYFASSVVISLLTGSRAGFLANGAFAVWLFVHWFIRIWREKSIFTASNRHDRVMSLLSIILSICIFGVYVAAQGGARHELHPEEQIATPDLFDNLTDRMTSIGDEPGSQGRLNMWQYIPAAVSQNPLGYGLGNGIEIIRSYDADTISEGNIHNIYFQALLDYGIAGLVVLLIAVALFIKKELPTLAAWPISAFILCYLCLGLIQYRMLEVPAWIAVTAYVSANRVERAKEARAKT